MGRAALVVVEVAASVGVFLGRVRVGRFVVVLRFVWSGVCVVFVPRVVVVLGLAVGLVFEVVVAVLVGRGRRRYSPVA